jgi:hypothetical protein
LGGTYCGCGMASNVDDRRCDPLDPLRSKYS